VQLVGLLVSVQRRGKQRKNAVKNVHGVYIKMQKKKKTCQWLIQNRHNLSQSAPVCDGSVTIIDTVPNCDWVVGHKV